MKLQSFINQNQNLPNIWGEGLIFAFSGLDGQTQSTSGFTLTAHNRPYSFLIHTPKRHILEIDVEETGKVLAATSDVLVVQFDEELLLVTFSAWHSVVGFLPSHIDLRLIDKTSGCSRTVSGVSQKEGVLKVEFRGNRFCLSYGNDIKMAKERALAGLDIDAEEVAMTSLMKYENLPALKNRKLERLMKKCLSVMRVNSLDAEGIFEQHWSTPDRVPHKDLWLWDSVFHSIGMNEINPAISWEFLKSVLDHQYKDGMISHQVSVNGKQSNITQPPILSWGVWENYLHLKDQQCLAYAAPRLERYLVWDMANRDQKQNQLLQWFIQENENCRSGESGMDNSPRFDEALTLDAVDFSVFLAVDANCLSKIFEVLGKPSKRDYWGRIGESVEKKIHDELWDTERGFYFDRNMNGVFSNVWAVTGFIPLILPNFPEERTNRLLELLADPKYFKTRFPIPSVSVSDPQWSTDMWRGATWVNMNYLIIEGLLKQGCGALAESLRQQTISMVEKYYEESGVIFEFYDARDTIPPMDCDRKGPPIHPYDLRLKVDSIRDYHWSAALVIKMLMMG